jgi:ATP-binding cassette, subfamily B, bacterial MsbA
MTEPSPESDESDKDEARKIAARPLIKRFWPFMRPHLRYVWVTAALQIIATPLALIAPLVIREVVDDAVGPGAGAGEADVLYWGAILVALSLASVGLGLLVGYLLTLFHTKIRRDLRLRLYRHVQALPLAWYADRETGWIMSRQTDDVDNLDGVLADRFVNVVVDALRGVGYLVMLFYVEWRMATAGLILVAVVFGFAYAISAALRQRNRRALETWTDLSTTIHQGVSGHLLVQATGGETREAIHFLGRLHRQVRAALSRDLFSLWTNHVYSLISGIGPSIIVLGGVYLIVTSDFTVGGLFAFFMYLVQMFGAVASVAGFNATLQRSLASLERIFEVLDTPNPISSPAGGGLRHEVQGSLALEGVSFAYGEGPEVLREIDLEIPAQSMVALVGSSGSGKTTLARLVPRFFDPAKGRVTVDGHDLRSLALRHYRRQVGLVPQDVFLFDRSVSENIAFGRQDASEAEIRAAARAARAEDFIDELPQGFATMIGERGVKLSGGQRQRLAIAREILRDPRILILDEATSALDSESEAAIQAALETLLVGRTSIVIAHRLSTIIQADLICVLEEGRIVERGVHADLLASGGRYAELYRTQFERHLRPETPPEIER